MPTNAVVLWDAELTLLPWRDVESLPGVRADIVATSNDPAMVRWTTVPHPYTPEHADEFLAVVPEGVERWAYVLDGRYAGSIELRPAVNWDTTPRRGPAARGSPPARCDLSPPTRSPKVCGG